MSDRYSQLVNAPVVAHVAKQLGLPQPVSLDRYEAGAPGRRRRRSSPAPPPAAGSARHARRPASTQIKAERAGAEGKAKALVFDATGIADSTELVELQRFFYPAVGRLQRSGRVVVARHAAGRRPARPAPTPRSGRWRASPARSARRSAAAARPCSSSTSSRAPRTSSTRPCASCSRRARPTSPARSCGSARASPPTPEIDWERPLAGKMALVTGASRGIGAAIAATLARDGAEVVGLDVPQAADDLRAVTAAIGGEAIELDITAADAPERIAARFAGRRRRRRPQRRRDQDRTIAKMPEERWAQLMEINLSSEERINDALLDAELLDANGRIVCVSSMSGIAGNSGQTNYATSKAGVIGMVEALAPGAGRARGDDQRRRPRLHRDADDRGDADRPARSRPPAQQPLARAGCRSTSPRRSPGSPAPPRPASTATSSASAARACWGPDDGDPHARQLPQHPAALRARRGADGPRRLAAAVRPRRRRRDPRARARAGRASSPTRRDVAAYAKVCGFTLRDQLPAHLPARARLPAAHGGDGRRRLPVRRRRPRPRREPDRPAPPRSGSARS